MAITCRPTHHSTGPARRAAQASEFKRRNVTALPYAVALVIAPDFGEKLHSLSLRLHVWAVDTLPNRRVAEEIWSALPSPGAYNIESGVTIFTPYGKAAEDWCLGAIDSLDQHHDSSSHEPGYTVLEVYGVAPSAAIRKAFQTFGFAEFVATAYGFIAQKAEP